MAEKASKKIAFVGTSCTGKTTLTEVYKERFQNNRNGAIVEEAARIYFTKNPHITDRFSMEAQSGIQEMIMEMERIAHEQDVQVILCDRSVLDSVAYLKAAGDHEGATELLERMKEWIPSYHKIFLLDPADVPYQQDEIRTETAEARQGFHDAFLSFFMEAGVEYELLSGTLEQRTARVPLF